MKKTTLILIVILHLPFVLFSRELTLMHDKGGTPNYQPYFEEISKLTEKEIGVSYTGSVAKNELLLHFLTVQ